VRINGSNFISAGNVVSVDELNLRDGQKIIGRVISASTDEALLEMAGRCLRAKVEDAPEVQSGAVLKFLVKRDPEGRVLLKALANDQEANNSGKTGNMVDPNLQKAIAMALTEEGLPVTQGKIDNFAQMLQSFQAKYQQALPPKVLAFINAQNWQVNPETIITAWLFQDDELRDLLWNLLDRTNTGQSDSSLLTRMILNMSAKPEELQSKLQTLAKQLDALVRYLNDRKSNSMIAAGQKQTVNHGLLRHLITADDSDLTPFLRQLTAGLKTNESLRQFNPNEKSELSKTPIFNELKQLASKLNESVNSNALREKIEVLLDRNLALNKAMLQENSISGNFNLIPLLINDPQNMLHEVLIKWREEPSEQKEGTVEQVLGMNIPTDNMGVIRLMLRTGPAGTQINFKVDNNSVRKYLLRNLDELKKNVNNKDLIIKVGLTPKEKDFGPAFQGVDLWI
jgi:hypothetical protein